MPVWSARLQRTALAHLVAGFGIGAVLLAGTGLGLPVAYRPLLALHAELLLVGWMLQFTMGVAYWMLPKHASGPARGPAGFVVTAWVLLNAGVLVAGLGLALGASAGLVTLGRVAELGAVVAFAANAWPRIKPFGAGRSVS